MKKVRKTYSLRPETVERIREAAKAGGVSESRAVEELVAGTPPTAGSETVGERERELLEANIADLRAQVELLRGQLEAKDEQIARLDLIAEHAQQLQAHSQTEKERRGLRRLLPRRKRQNENQEG